MENEREIVFDGSFADCVRHFSQVLKELDDRSEAARLKRFVASFCEVSLDAVNDWVTACRALPRGDRLIRFMCFLSMIGYQIWEMEKTSKSKPVIFGFTELIGFGLLDVVVAKEKLGINNVSHFYELLAGKRRASLERDKNMREILIASRQELEVKKREVYNLFLSGCKVKSEKVNFSGSTEQPIVFLAKAMALLIGTDCQLDVKSLSEEDKQVLLRLSACLSSLALKIYAGGNNE